MMRRKKSSFLAFFCSLIPGAGEMYIGFMKRGLSIMLIFWGLIFISAWSGLGSLLFGMPIIWFYSFFEVHNLRSMPEQMLDEMSDEYFLLPDINTDKMKSIQNKYRNLFALILIILGLSILWNNLYDMLEGILPDAISEFIFDIGYYFPQFFIACAIIALGLYLIRGKKKELDLKEEMALLEDKGGKAE